MPSADLTDLTRVKELIGWDTTFTAGEDTALDNMIDAASEAIEKFCARGFASTTYDELYQANNNFILVLRQYPIISIARLATDPTAVLTITNTSAVNQRATVAVTSTGLTLVRVASGVTTTTTAGLTWAANATLAALATAVNALGSGWVATAAVGHTLRSPADLRAIQGAMSAMNAVANLEIHTSELSSYDIDAPRGVINCFGPGRWPESSYDSNSAPISREYRIVYTAGYATIPEDIAQACALWVADSYVARQQQPNYQSKATGTTNADTSSTSTSESWFQARGMPARVRQLLLPYRKYTY